MSLRGRSGNNAGGLEGTSSFFEKNILYSSQWVSGAENLQVYSPEVILRPQVVIFVSWRGKNSTGLAGKKLCRIKKPIRPLSRRRVCIAPLIDDVFVHDDLLEVLEFRQLVHDVEHRRFEDGTKTSRPVLRRSASAATARNASSVNRNFTCSNPNSFLYCLTSAFFGSREYEPAHPRPIHASWL